MKNDLLLEKAIRSIPGFPKPGIIFRDITTLLQDKKAFIKAIEALVRINRGKKIDKVVAVESRGFIFGACLAHRLKTGFIPVRKKGKLPYKTISASYELEYGTDTLEIHEDAIKPGENILIVDDLLATGGTVKAVVQLVKQLQGKIVGIGFVIELVDLHGRDKFKEYPVDSLVKFSGE